MSGEKVSVPAALTGALRTLLEEHEKDILDVAERVSQMAAEPTPLNISATLSVTVWTGTTVQVKMAYPHGRTTDTAGPFDLDSATPDMFGGEAGES